MTNQEIYNSKKGTLQDAYNLIKSGDTVIMGGDLACAREFSGSFHTQADRLENVLVFKDSVNRFDYARMPGMNGHINTSSFFFGPDTREGFKYGNSRLFMSDLHLYSRNILATRNPNVIVYVASPMDENGDMQIGISNMWEGDCLEYVIEHGGKVIIESNPNVVRMNGAPKVNIKDVTMVIETDYKPHEIPPLVATETDIKVAGNVRELLKDGDCIQVGFGSLPNAIMEQCMDLKDLGMHTEMVTTTMGKMIKAGIINGSRKTINKGEHIFCFAGGTQELFEILDKDPNCRIGRAGYVLDPFVIMQNDNMVSVNTLIEIDLTGQICSEGIGVRQFSGSGGAFDFAYGAMRSKGGRGIMAFASQTAKGVSKIVPTLKTGAPVTVPRNYADYIVTEYGVANLRGLTVPERVRNLIAIAHPDHRKELEEAAKEFGYI